MSSAEQPHKQTTEMAKMDSSLLGHNSDWWSAAMLASLGLAAFIAFLVAAATGGVIIVQKREATAAKAELDRYKLTVDGRIADAKKEGIEAGKTAGDAELKASQANERAAKLEKEAAEANLKAEILKKELGWREVTTDQAAKLRATLQGKPMSIVLHWGAGDAEASHFAHTLASALHDAGLTIIGGNPIGQLGEERHGISVAGWRKDEVTTLATALERAGYGKIETTVVSPPAGPNAPGQYTDIFVGYREAPKL